MKRLLALLLLCASVAFPQSVLIYGTGVGGSQIGNNRIGPAAEDYPEQVIRFRANYSEALSTFIMYYISGGSYSGGATCDLRVRLYNNGTGGLPDTSSVLAEVSWTHTNTNDEANLFEEKTFSSPYTLTAGNAYHLWFRNMSADPDANYISINSMYSTDWDPDRSMQPKNNGDSLALSKVQYRRATTAWSYGASPYYPFIRLKYASGKFQGNGNVDVAFGTQRLIYGASYRVREVFTPSANYTMAGAGISIDKEGTPGDLQLRVELAGDNSEVGTVTIGVGDVPTSHNWVYGTFSSPISLSSGTAYNFVVLTATGDGSNCYRTYEVQSGLGYPITGHPADFGDNSKMQHIAGGSWGDTHSTVGDLPFYLKVYEEEEEPPAPTPTTKRLMRR